MMKVLLPIMIIALLGGIVGLVFLIKSIRKNINKEYKGANIISFLFPIVGLIIYAVNISKNDKLAKSCVKMALYGMGFGVLLSIIICFICLTLYYGIFNLNTHTVKGTKTQITEIKNDNLDDIKTSLLQNDKITSCDIKTVGLSVNIKINFAYNTDVRDAKSIVEDIFKNSLNKDYSYTVNIYVGDDNYYGYYYKNEKFIWAN